MSSWLKAILKDGSFIKIPYYFDGNKDEAAYFLLCFHKKDIESVWISTESKSKVNEETSIHVLQDRVDELTQELLIETLSKTGGKQQEAAKLLGYNPISFGRLMCKYGIATKRGKYKKMCTITDLKTG
jgi:transcriptional regulator with GAF, ATPase, and Fis domain